MGQGLIEVNAGRGGDKVWTLVGIAGVAGVCLGWVLGGVFADVPDGQPEAAPRAVAAPLIGAGACPPTAGQGPFHAVAQPGRSEAETLTSSAQAVRHASVDAAERNAMLNAILGRPEGAALSDAELAQHAPQALMAKLSDPELDADARIEAAFAMQTYFDTPVPTPAMRQVLDMAAAQGDALLQQDALDLLDGQMRVDLIPAVSAFLHAPDPSTRQMAIQRLRELPDDSQARAALAQVAEQDESEVLRYLAARVP